jgi:hypothetical protein
MSFRGPGFKCGARQRIHIPELQTFVDVRQGILFGARIKIAKIGKRPGSFNPASSKTWHTHFRFQSFLCTRTSTPNCAPLQAFVDVRQGILFGARIKITKIGKRPGSSNPASSKTWHTHFRFQSFLCTRTSMPNCAATVDHTKKPTEPACKSCAARKFRQTGCLRVRRHHSPKSSQ